MSPPTNDSSSNRRPGFSIRVDGPKVGEARLSANDLAEIVRRTQQALKRVGQVLYGESSVGKGRKKKEIEELCELFIVGWKPGSAIAELELAEPPSQLSLLDYIGDESLNSFLKGIHRIQEGTAEHEQSMPAGFDSGVLQACDALGSVLEHGIDSVRFEPRQGLGVPSVSFDRSLRERVRELLGKRVEQSQVEKVGRLEVLDGHSDLRGRLWEADGTKWVCLFKPEHLDVLPDVWLHTVKLVGEAILEPNREQTLKVDSVLALEDETVEVGSPTARFSFWSSTSLDDLIEQQGVLPADDLDSIASLWPVDDDPDELLRHILAERSARCGIAGEGRS